MIGGYACAALRKAIAWRFPPRGQAATPRAQGVNAGLNVSAEGRRLLRTREGFRDHFYNDNAGNCSFGVGQLAHMGPCNFQEAGRPVSTELIERSLSVSINRYAEVVRRGVANRALTQSQLDALTSFVFNVPALAPQILRHVDAGEDAQALDVMRHAVNVHDHDAHGHVRGPARRSAGLVTRRRSEMDEYNQR